MREMTESDKLFRFSSFEIATMSEKVFEIENFSFYDEMASKAEGNALEDKA